MKVNHNDGIKRINLLKLTTESVRTIKEWNGEMRFTDWAIWEDYDNQGLYRSNLAVMNAEDGEAYYTQSRSFIDGFVKILGIMGSDFTDFVCNTVEGTNGEYLICKAGSATESAAHEH